MFSASFLGPWPSSLLGPVSVPGSEGGREAVWPAILKIGLACLFVLLLFVDSFPHNEIILWLVLMLMAGALICFGGACWLAARSMGKDDEPPGQD